MWGKGARGPCPGKGGWGGLRDSEQKGSQVGLTCSGGAAAGVDGPGSTAGPGRAACVPGTASACRSFLLLNAAFKPRHRFSARCLFFLSVSSSRSTAAMQVVSALNLNRAWGEGRKVDRSAGERGREREGEGGGGSSVDSGVLITSNFCTSLISSNFILILY